MAAALSALYEILSEIALYRRAAGRAGFRL